MPNRDWNDTDKAGKAGASILAALILGGLGMAASSKSKEKLQQELNEINYELSNEKRKVFLFRDDEKIRRLENRKNEIMQKLG